MYNNLSNTSQVQYLWSKHEWRWWMGVEKTYLDCIYYWYDYKWSTFWGENRQLTVIKVFWISLGLDVVYYFLLPVFGAEWEAGLSAADPQWRIPSHQKPPLHNTTYCGGGRWRRRVQWRILIRGAHTTEVFHPEIQVKGATYASGKQPKKGSETDHRTSRERYSAVQQFFASSYYP